MASLLHRRFIRSTPGFRMVLETLDFPMQAACVLGLRVCPTGVLDCPEQGRLVLAARNPALFREGLARLGRRFTKRCALSMPKNKASRREGSPGRLSFGVEATLGCEGNSLNCSGRQPCSGSANLACLLQQLRGNELFQRRTLPRTLFASARLPCCARRQQTTCRFPSIVESTTTCEGPDSG